MLVQNLSFVNDKLVESSQNRIQTEHFQVFFYNSDMPTNMFLNYVQIDQYSYIFEEIFKNLNSNFHVEKESRDNMPGMIAP